MAVLNEENLKPKKYTAIFKPDSNLGNGFYFVVLKINDLQVHYLKIVKV